MCKLTSCVSRKKGNHKNDSASPYVSPDTCSLTEVLPSIWELGLLGTFKFSSYPHYVILQLWITPHSRLVPLTVPKAFYICFKSMKSLDSPMTVKKKLKRKKGTDRNVVLMIFYLLNIITIIAIIIIIMLLPDFLLTGPWLLNMKKLCSS